MAAQSSKSRAWPRKYTMPLIEPDPPTTRPRGSGMRRLSSLGCGAVMNRQFRCGRAMAAPTVAGIWMNGWRASPPASSKHTELRASSDRRAARTHPAVPAPTTTKSKELSMFNSGPSRRRRHRDVRQALPALDVHVAVHHAGSQADERHVQFRIHPEDGRAGAVVAESLWRGERAEQRVAHARAAQRKAKTDVGRQHFPAARLEDLAIQLVGFVAGPAAMRTRDHGRRENARATELAAASQHFREAVHVRRSGDGS